MKKERMKILSMIEEGKITVDEATKLLEILSSTQDVKDDPYCNDLGYDFEDKINSFSNSVDNFVKEFSEKVDSTCKNVEPKIKKAGKKVLEKTANVVDDISKSLNESLRNFEENDDICNCEDSCNCEEDIDENKPREN